jgi:uncharacterized protein (TIGR02271 family)
MTATQRPSVVAALFTEESQAQEAVDALLHAGFNRDRISFAGHGTQQGLLASIKSLFRKDSASMNDVYNDLVTAGLPERAAQYFCREYDAGRSIVEVLGTGDMQRAVTILRRYGGYGAPPGEKAEDVSSRQPMIGTEGEQRQQPMIGTEGEQRQQPMTGAEGEQHMYLREEQLQIGKQTVQTGTAGLRKEVITEQKSVDVPVTHEEIYVERRPGSGQQSDTPIGEGETYRVPVNEEQVVVSKQPIEKEEIVLRKQQVQGVHRVNETVRREEAHVEREGDAPFQNRERDSRLQNRERESRSQNRERESRSQNRERDSQS